MAGLIARWIEHERATGRSVVDILADLNEACGTRYKHNWMTQIQTRPSQNLPVCVRRYMMAKVLPALVAEHTARGKIKNVEALIDGLT